jgi:hypothetical protein
MYVLGYTLADFSQTHLVTLHWPYPDYKPVLWDGIFSNQNPNLGKNFEGLRIEKNGILYGHMEYFTAIWLGIWSN